MPLFFIKRLTTLLLALLVASAVIFVAMETLPGDIATVVLGACAREDTPAAFRAQHGLDRPIPERYLAWIGNLVRGDLGESYTYSVPVSELILIFAVQLGWLSTGGFAGWENGIWPGLVSLLMPAIALALPQAAILARVTRSSMLETLGEDYVRTARAKGLSKKAVLWRHALRNGLIPVVSIMGLQFSFLLAGTIIIENVFQRRHHRFHTPRNIDGAVFRPSACVVDIDG